MAFIEAANMSYSQLADEFPASREYQTKTAGT